MPALLSVRNLEVVYGRAVRAIRGISFEVPAGSVVGLIGINGAGKTTTIRAVSGFLPAENVRIAEGTVELDGVHITGWTPHRTARAGIAVVAEREKVFDTLTVEENLQLAMTGARARSAGGTTSRLQDVHRWFPRLAERAGSLAVYLSGGERQMLGMAACLLQEPRLLIIDEASLGLAPSIRESIFRQLRALNEETGLTMLIVDQDVSAVLRVADYGYVMEHGRIVFDGTAEALRSHGDIQEFYLGNSSSGVSRGYRDVKQYRRVRRWY